MWQPIQMMGGLLVVAAGVLIFRGRRRGAPRPGAWPTILRLLRRLAGVLAVLVGLGVTLEGTPAVSAQICLDLEDGGPQWCFGGDGRDDAASPPPGGEASR